MIGNEQNKNSLKEFLDGKQFGEIRVEVDNQGLVLTDNRGRENIDFTEIEEIIFGTEYDEHRIKIEKTNGDVVELHAYPVVK